MTDQPKIRLFSITIHAWRMVDGNSEVNIQNVVALLGENVDIAIVANDHARTVYPSDEWRDQQAIWTEIPQDWRVGPFHLTWQAEIVGDDTAAGVGL
jgi:hypothetical protein